MTESRERPTPADGADTPDDLPLDDVIAIQGDVVPDEQDAVITPDEMEHERTPTLTEFERGDSPPDPTYAADEAAVLDDLDLDDLREGETDDPDVAAEEGLVYVPPIDPPVHADQEEEDGLIIAAGAAVSAESEPYDEDHRGSDLPGEPELTARIREALRADAATAGLVDRLLIGVRGSTAVIRGVVDGIEDTDTIVEVVERVDGISDVVDETEVVGG